MSLVTWYHYKADQCARMAKNANDPHTRTNYEEMEKLWLEIAEQITRDEESRAVPKAN